MMFQGLGVTSRHSVLHPLGFVCFSHLGFALVCFNRPNLDMLTKAYQPFGNLTPWGLLLLGLVVFLWFAPRSSIWLMLAELGSAFAFFTIAYLLTLGVGLLPTMAGGPLVAGVVSLMLFARTVGAWLGFQDWYLDLLVTPPRFVQRSRIFQKLRDKYGRDNG